MRLKAMLNRFDKLLHAFFSFRLIRAFVFYRVLVGAEHRFILARKLSTVIDIGANRGQFALAVRKWVPNAKLFSFEPLAVPAAIFRRVFSGDTMVKLFDAAIGPDATESVMHISARDDSSSLLPISSLQDKVFPGTCEVDTINVRVAPLCAFVSENDIVSPALLKLDVQGYEFDALRGCESLLQKFDWIYCECSFVELYSGQKLADIVINWLSDRGFKIKGIHNIAYDRDGETIQADFLFKRC